MHVQEKDIELENAANELNHLEAEAVELDNMRKAMEVMSEGERKGKMQDPHAVENLMKKLPFTYDICCVFRLGKKDKASPSGAAQ